MPQRNIKGLTGLAAQKAVDVAKRGMKKYNKWATTNRTINGQEVVSAMGPDLEYGVKKIGQSIGNLAGRAVYGKIKEYPSTTKKKK